MTDTTHSRPSRVPILLAALLLALAAANASRYAPYVEDDSYISLRYARNLVEGHGLVFNPLERVEGYTNFLYVVLAAFLMKAGLAPVLGLKLAGAALGAATLFGTARLEGLGRTGAGGRPLPLSVLLLLPLEAFVYWSLCPLETILFTALLLFGLLAMARESAARRGHASALLFVLLALTRPEGVALFGVATAAFLFVESRTGGLAAALRRHAVNAVVFLALFGTYFVLRWRYYGSLFPNTTYAKVTGGAGALLTGFEYLGAFALAFPLLAAMLFLPLSRGARRFSPAFASGAIAIPLLAVSWAQVAEIVAVGGDAMPFFRFFLPVLPLLAVFLAWTLAAASEAWPSRARVLVPAALAVHVVVSLFTVQPYRAFIAHRTAVVGERLGARLREELPPSALVAVNTAGSLPYESRLPALDTLGLTDAAIAHRPVFIDSPGWAGHRRGWGAYVLSRRPKVILFYNSAGSRDPYYLGDRELADDHLFRFFYRLRTVRLPAAPDRGPVARFAGFPFGRTPSGRAPMADYGMVAIFHEGPLPHTELREGEVLANVFERDERDDALWELAGAAGGDPSRFVDLVGSRWSAESAVKGAAPDPAERARVEAMCDEALRKIQSNDAPGAGVILAEAAAQNGAARSPRVYQYLANVAVMAGDLFVAVSAEKEALRLVPESPLYRQNLAGLLTVPFKEAKKGAARRP